MRVEPKTIGIAALTHTPLGHEIHAIWMTNWPFYLNCVRPSISVVTCTDLATVCENTSSKFSISYNIAQYRLSKIYTTVHV